MARSSSSSIPSTISELFLYIYIYNCTFCTIGRYEKETHHLLDYINQKHTHTYKTDQHQQLHNIPIPMILFLRLKTKKSHFLHTMGLTVVLSGGGMHVQIDSEGCLSYLTIFKSRGLLLGALGLGLGEKKVGYCFVGVIIIRSGQPPCLLLILHI